MNRNFDNALIFLNGDEADLSYAKELMGGQTILIGCDGGTDKIYELGFKPHAVIGDFDSIKKLPARIKNLPEDLYGKEVSVDNIIYIKHPPEKDFLDVELALDLAIKEGVKEVNLVNAGGDELDHVLGTLIILARRKYQAANIHVLSPTLSIYVAEGDFTIDGRKGDKVSLIPIYGDVKVEKSSGLKYDPAKYTMSLSQNIGISNELTSKKATLRLSKGRFLVIHHR